MALIPLALAGTLVLGACSSSDEEATATADLTATAEATQAPTEAPTEVATPAAETVAITAVDYGFEGVPQQVAVGSTLTLKNASTAELHELVAIRLADDETRTAEELAALPEEELGALFANAQPTMVILAMPGGEGTAVIGDGTITEAGRYLLICAIPVGADPEAFMAAAATATDGPPQVEGGAPHYTEGMYAELFVQ